MILQALSCLKQSLAQPRRRHALYLAGGMVLLLSFAAVLATAVSAQDEGAPPPGPGGPPGGAPGQAPEGGPGGPPGGGPGGPPGMPGAPDAAGGGAVAPAAAGTPTAEPPKAPMLTEADLRANLGQEGGWFDSLIQSFIAANAEAEAAMRQAIASGPTDDAELLARGVYLRGEAIAHAETIWALTKNEDLKGRLETYVYVARVQNAIASRWVPYQTRVQPQSQGAL